MIILWDLEGFFLFQWRRRGELNPSPKIASAMSLHA